MGSINRKEFHTESSYNDSCCRNQRQSIHTRSCIHTFHPFLSIDCSQPHMKCSQFIVVLRRSDKCRGIWHIRWIRSNRIFEGKDRFIKLLINLIDSHRANMTCSCRDQYHYMFYRRDGIWHRQNYQHL